MRKEYVKKKILILLLLLNLLVGLYRLFVSLNLQEFTWNHEKCEKYTIIKEVSEGRGYDFFRLVDAPLIGYTIFHTYLAVPFYYIFHSPFLAFISVNLIFSIFMIVAIFIFLSKFFNPKAAVIGSLFFSSLFSNLFVPHRFKDGYLFSHFFGFLAIFFFYSIFFQKKRQRSFAIMGLLVGIAVLLHYTGLVYFFSIMISWFIFDKKFLLKKEFGIFLIFFLLGISLEFFIEFQQGFTYGFKRFTSERVEHAFLGHSLFEIQKNVLQRLIDLILPSQNIFAIFMFLTFMLPFLITLFTNFKSLLRAFLCKPNEKTELTKIPLIVLVTFILFFLLVSYIDIWYMSYPLFISLSLISAIFFSKFIFNRSYKGIFSLVILIITLSISTLNNFIPLFFHYNLYPINIITITNKFPTFVQLPLITECYDVNSYDIAEKYWKNFSLFIENCERLGEYKFYCYRAMGEVIGKNIWNLSLAKEYCDRFEFKEWCYEGLYEEVGYHILDNLNVVKEIELFHYDSEKWKHLYLPEHYKGLDLASSKIDLKKCEQVPEEYKKECYSGLGKVWRIYTFRTYGSYDKGGIRKICDYLEDPYRVYCYIGSFNVLDERLPPYTLDCMQICNYEYACYEGVSEKIAFRYTNPLIASLACEYVSGDNENFKNICYNKIGYFLADRFMYNLSKAFEYCKIVKESSACNEGIRNFIERRKILTTSLGKSCCRIEKDDLLINEQTKLCNETYELWDSNFNGAIVVSGSNFVLNCNSSNILESTSKVPWYVRLSNKVVNFAKGMSNAQTIGIKIENANNFTLKNCKIMGFDLGILIKNSTNIKIEDSIIGFGGRGIVVEKTKNLTLINTTLRDMSLHGLHFLDSTGLLVRNSSFEEVKEWECILIRNSKDVVIKKNKFLSSYIGIGIERNSTNIKIENNVFKDMKYCLSTDIPSLENVYAKDNFFGCKNFSYRRQVSIVDSKLV